MKEHKVEYIDNIRTKANKIINRESNEGYYPIQISYSTGFGGHGLVILFEREKCTNEQ